MKIVLFSSSYPGDANKLNISLLIKSFPSFEYTYVIIDTRAKYIKNKIKNYIKEIILICLLKKTDWYSARRKTEHNIAKEVPVNFDKHINKIFVKSVNGIETENIIRKLHPDLMIQCGAGILKENIFSIPKIGTLNVHHGISPEIRGVSSTFWSMYYGLYDYIGTTIHFIDKTLDTGAVIIQKKTILPEEFNYVEAVFQTQRQGALLLPEAVKILLGNYTLSEKDVMSFYFSSVTYKKYWELKKNNFKPLGNVAELKTKVKRKKEIFVITLSHVHTV